MDDRERVIEVSEHIATAIAQRDVRAIRALLAPDFLHRTIGGEATDVETFLQAIEQIHGEIVFIRLDELQIDVSGTGALVTGNDAGLSVPGWPTSFGSFRMPPMVGGVKFEHGHRMIAGVVGILTIRAYRIAVRFFFLANKKTGAQYRIIG